LRGKRVSLEQEGFRSAARDAELAGYNDK
jgi:hypothetical protein